MREEPTDEPGRVVWVARRLALCLSAPAAMLIVFVVGLLFVSVHPVPRAVTSSIGPKLHAIGVPLRLEIPSLGATAPIIPIEVRNDVLTPPADVRMVGWWRGSAQPYSPTGQTLITGHATHVGYSPLNNLRHIRPGASIVIRSKKKTASYLVQSVAVWNKKKVSEHADELFDPDTPDRRLVLVTSADYDGHRWNANVIVLAQPN